jgi:hypothetical protein
VTVLSADHDVIEHRNPAQLADLAKPGRQLDVGPRRRRIARRVVVTEQHRSDAPTDERAKHVARVDLDACQAASRGDAHEKARRSARARRGRDIEKWHREYTTPPARHIHERTKGRG